MGDLTKNISQHELDCKCGKCDFTILPDEEVIEVVQGACDHFAKIYDVERVSLKITSGARCTDHNRSVDSNDNSQHPRARAIDHKIYVNGEQLPPSEVAAYYDRRYPDKFGIGVYNTFTHIDTRRSKARW